jgi:hypothetical protein
MGPLLVSYLDESGTNEQSPIITIAGYIALVSAWARFEASTRSIFDAYGVRYLHGVDFQNRKPRFNTWSRIKQRTFVIELFDAVRRTVEFGVTFSVRKDAYLQAKRIHARNRNESASLIGRLGQALSGYPPTPVRCRSRARASLRTRHQGPSIMGFEDEVEQSFGRPCRQCNGRLKRTHDLTSSVVPRGTSFHHWVESQVFSYLI